MVINNEEKLVILKKLKVSRTSQMDCKIDELDPQDSVIHM